jgi:hypothetical protein
MNRSAVFVLVLVASGAAAALIHWVLAELFARRRTPILYFVSVFVLWAMCSVAFQYLSTVNLPAPRAMPIWRYYLDALLSTSPLAVIPALLVSFSMFRSKSTEGRVALAGVGALIAIFVLPFVALYSSCYILHSCT